MDPHDRIDCWIFKNPILYHVDGACDFLIGLKNEFDGPGDIGFIIRKDSGGHQ